jgi:hypothetical protein
MNPPVAPPAALTPDAARTQLQEQLYAPVFFNELNKLAGIAPQNAAEAQELLEMGSVLYEVHQRQVAKQASVSRFGDALASLRGGASGSSQAREAAQRATDTFVEATGLPSIKAAALALGRARLSQLA